MEKDQSTEARIFEAASAVFYEKGYAGARMQEIADRAGINKAMLHYYYRNKDKLFEGVFRTARLQVLGPVLDVLDADLPLREKIERAVHTYIDQLVAHPEVPSFVLHELRRHPDRVHRFIDEEVQVLFRGLAHQIRETDRRSTVEPVAPEHVVVNLVALCVFPFVGRPVIQAVLGLDEARFAAFIQERKQTVTIFMCNALGL